MNLSPLLDISTGVQIVLYKCIYLNEAFVHLKDFLTCDRILGPEQANFAFHHNTTPTTTLLQLLL